MNRILEEIFKNKVIDFDRLIEYGFALVDDKYLFNIEICNSQLSLSVEVDKRGDINTQVVDLETNEPYTLFLVEDAMGSFVGEVRQEYENALTDIAQKCCKTQVFKSKYAQDVIEYIRNKYGDELEFLWKKFDDNAIWRRKDNNKWYGLMLIIPKSKLGFNSEEKVEIIDLRMSPQEVERVIDNKRYYSAYHMNKKSWITICLDGSLELDELYSRIDDSYVLALKK